MKSAGRDLRSTRLHYMQVDEDMIAELKAIWPVIEPALPALLADFYAHMRSEPRLAAMLGKRAESLVGAQSDHWRLLFNNGFDDTYVASVQRIGSIHNRIDLEPRWYICGYTFIQRRLIDLLAKHYRWRQRRLQKAVRAMVTAVNLDIDLALSTYFEAYIAEREARAKILDKAICDFDQLASSAAESVVKAARVVSESAGQINGSSNGNSSDLKTLAGAAEELTSSIGEIGRQLDGAREVAGKATSGAQNAEAQIRDLATAVEQINEVVTLIGQIAEQTNLLALNATIEAARAGDAGRGFAVVAAEVKALAQQTAKATGEVGEKIGHIQSSTGRTVDVIGTVARMIVGVEQATVAISSAIEEQDAATKDIAVNIQAVSGRTNAVARQNEALLSASNGVAGEVDMLRSAIKTFVDTASAA